jgi:hypothetical protein
MAKNKDDDKEVKNKSAAPNKPKTPNQRHRTPKRRTVSPDLRMGLKAMIGRKVAVSSKEPSSSSPTKAPG